MSEEEPTHEQPTSQVSMELPVVVLGEEGAAPAPRRRLLLGRVSEGAVLYPIYLLTSIAGLIASQFAVRTEEWSVIPVVLAWGMLYLWYWFYGVAYRYRRRLLKYTSVFMVLSMSALVSLLCVDKAAAQLIATSDGLRKRSAEAILVWPAVITLAAAGLLIFHVVFLGRGYREKKPHGKKRSIPQQEVE